jgi:hypothetical protein
MRHNSPNGGHRLKPSKLEQEDRFLDFKRPSGDLPASCSLYIDRINPRSRRSDVGSDVALRVSVERLGIRVGFDR